MPTAPRIFRAMRSLMLSMMFFVNFSVCAGQERYYYSGRDYGSEAMYNPLSLILNGSYDIIQLEGHARDFLTYPYRAGARNVLHNLGSPFSAIARHGVSNFLRREVFPLSFSVGEAQWWPNYQLHLIGGGMTYVATREWFEIHGFAAPALWSIATVSAYHLLNEIVENGSYEGVNVDPIADIYIFDIGGIVLFSFDGINRFFSRELHMADWSMQPSVGFPGWTLQNNGQYFSVKWKLPFSESLHLFYYFGLRGLLGLSQCMENGGAVSVGVGMRATKLQTVDAATNTKTVELHWNVGFFYDRDNSLMASLFLSEYTDNAVTLNLYPGVLPTGDFKPGVWLIYSRTDGVIVGLSTVYTPGIGVRLH